MQKPQVTLIVPGCTQEIVQEGHQENQSNKLSIVWNQDITKATSWQQQVADLVARPSVGHGFDVPVAAWGFTGIGVEGKGVCADPVHIQADANSATLIPPQALSLRSEESHAFVTSLNEFLTEDGLTLHHMTPESWLLSGLDASDLNSQPPSFLAHRNLAAYMPSDSGNQRWRRLLSETQMFLHDHPVNLKRQRRGLLPVNSLWFWGGAEAHHRWNAPPELDRSRCAIYADELLAQHMAHAMHLPWYPLEMWNTQQTQSSIIVDTRLGRALLEQDDAAAKLAFHSIQERYLRPLFSAAAVRRFEVTLFNEDGQSANVSGYPVFSFDYLQESFQHIIQKLTPKAK